MAKQLRTKYMKADSFLSPKDAVNWILTGGPVYYGHKFASAKWAANWSLVQIERIVKCGGLFRAVPNPAYRKPKPRGWISCEKRMPIHGQRVMCLYKGVYGPNPARYWFDGTNHHFGDHPASQPATHWKPIEA